MCDAIVCIRFLKVASTSVLVLDRKRNIIRDIPLTSVQQIFYQADSLKLGLLVCNPQCAYRFFWMLSPPLFVSVVFESPCTSIQHTFLVPLFLVLSIVVFFFLGMCVSVLPAWVHVLKATCA